MKLNLFLLCLTGIVPVTVTSVAHSYHLIMTPMTWSAAQNYCRQTYDDLAAVESFGDWLKISAVAVRNFMILPAWIGLYNNLDSWRWSLNNLPLKNTTLMNWYYSNPASGNEACGVIGSSGYWYADPCTNLHPFVCYDSRLSGTARFINYPLPLLNWFGAQAYCRQFHTDLATATNSVENNEIKSKVVLTTYSWFGLFRDTWTWVDGTIASNIPWAPFQPGAENCGTFAIGMMSDETCSSQYAVYCHSVPPVRQQQVIKLQVKSDGSVLNPDMQSSILEQLKQKLNENGLNITVSWRVQQDGNIFYKKTKKNL